MRSIGRKLLPFIVALGLLAGLLPLTALPTPTAHAATCTRVLGFLQTNQWFTGGFEGYLPSADWEMLYENGATIEDYADPGATVWSATVRSPACAGAPDRVVLNITGDYNSIASDWVTKISAAIPVIQAKYPSATTIVLQPPVGGPGYAVCPDGASTNKSTYNAPPIAQAIDTLVAPGIESGARPEVHDCADFATINGALLDATVFDYIALQIATFYGFAPTPTPTPTPDTGTTTVTFNDLLPADVPLDGEYPVGVIDWGTGVWYLAAPYADFHDQSIGYPAPGPTSAAFTFLGSQRLVSFEASNGSSVASTVSASCGSETLASTVVPGHALATITTGWTDACSVVTLSSSNGWDTNFDNLVIGTGGVAPTPTPVPTATPVVPGATSTPSPLCETFVRINGSSGFWIRRDMADCTPT